MIESFTEYFFPIFYFYHQLVIIFFSIAEAAASHYPNFNSKSFIVILKTAAAVSKLMAVQLLSLVIS